MSRIVIDIETVAAPAVESLLDPVRAPANYRDPAKIAAYQTEKLAEVIGKASLEPDLCEVVAVGWWREGDPVVQSLTRADQDEAGLITILMSHIFAVDDGATVVGFNCLNFDLPVLMRRSQLLGLTPPRFSLDRYRTPHVDLLEQLSFNGRLTYRSLAFYCRRFGIPVTDTIQGAEIPQLVAAGAWDQVQAHNAADVEKTAQLAHRLCYLKSAPARIEVVA